MTGADPLDQVVDRLAPVPGRTRVLAIAGPVAVGKSTIATELADRVRAGGASVEVVTTDGFLRPNAVLEAQGLLDRKGRPETYDLDRLDALVAAARAGEASLSAPVYSHQRYDVLDEPDVFARPDLLVVEGVVALQRRFGDLGVYVDAAVEDLEAWYVARMHDLVRDAADDPESFYFGWADLGPETVTELAVAVWTEVNLPNLVEDIAPSAARADVVVHKGPDHAIRALRWNRR
ncbi:MAG: type I pantothenate kinase [Acidimicrobiales bacterium]|nr:type I pantothenate kinase [Acidimicrobiales bacterium]